MVKTAVAVIDIGSNSIKSLLAGRNDRNELATLFEETIATRISAGIGGESPQLRNSAIRAGTETVRLLLDAIRGLESGSSAPVTIVATSAVREAGNSEQFSAAIKEETGIPLTILSGDDEAELISEGVREDPDLRILGDSFTLFDQGGGSMEWIAVRNGQVVARASLPLGAVRLMERYVNHWSNPVPATEVEEMKAFIRRQLSSLPMRIEPPAVACGGGVALMRSMIVDSPSNNRLDSSGVRRFCQRIVGIDLKSRIKDHGMDASRADIMPATAILFDTLLADAGIHHLYHSFYNLRYGVAARALRC